MSASCLSHTSGDPEGICATCKDKLCAYAERARRTRKRLYHIRTTRPKYEHLMDGDFLKTPRTADEIAAFLGTTRKHVQGTVLYNLRTRYGCIANDGEVKSRRYWITPPE